MNQAGMLPGHRQVDVLVGPARDALTTALAALAAPSHSVRIDLHDDDTCFVLSDALTTRLAQRLRWAEVADQLLE